MAGATALRAPSAPTSSLAWKLDPSCRRTCTPDAAPLSALILARVQNASKQAPAQHGQTRRRDSRGAMVLACGAAKH